MASKKVDIFLKTLAGHISKDPKAFKKPKRLRRGFELAVSNLQDGTLKKKLLKNLDDCFTELLRILKHQPDNDRKDADNYEDSRKNDESIKGVATADGPTNSCKQTTFLYNLYHKKNVDINQEAINQLHQSTQNIIYRIYMRCVLPHLDSKSLLDISAKCQMQKDGKFSWAGQIMELCACLHGHTDVHSLKAVMKIFNRKYAEAAENTTGIKRILKLVSYGKQFLEMFHFHYQTLDQEFEGRPKYEDYVAGILATHLDCYLQLFHCDPDSCPISGMELCSFVLRLLGKQHHYGYDVLLQLEHVHAEDGSLILPLARHLLDNVKQRDSCSLYTKFVIAARYITQWLPSETQDIKQKAFGVPAPNDYLTWIKNVDGSILDHFPETKHFSGVEITKYLLSEADEHVIQELFDLLTESYNVESGVDEMMKEDTTEDDFMYNGDLFVIDKTPDSAALSCIKDQFGPVENGSKEETLDSQDYEKADEEGINLGDQELLLRELEQQNEDHIQFEILTKEEAMEMNLIERTELALGRIFDTEKKEELRNPTAICSRNENDDKEGMELESYVKDREEKLPRMERTIKLDGQPEADQMDDVIIEIVDKDVEDGLVLDRSFSQNPDKFLSGVSFNNPFVIEDSSTEDCNGGMDTKCSDESGQLTSLEIERNAKYIAADGQNEILQRSPRKRKAVEKVASPLRIDRDGSDTFDMGKSGASPAKRLSVEVASKSAIIKDAQMISPVIHTKMDTSDQQEIEITSPPPSQTVTVRSVDQKDSFKKSTRKKSTSGQKELTPLINAKICSRTDTNGEENVTMTSLTCSPRTLEHSPVGERVSLKGYSEKLSRRKSARVTEQLTPALTVSNHNKVHTSGQNVINTSSTSSPLLTPSNCDKVDTDFQHDYGTASSPLSPRAARHSPADETVTQRKLSEKSSRRKSLRRTKAFTSESEIISDKKDSAEQNIGSENPVSENPIASYSFTEYDAVDDKKISKIMNQQGSPVCSWQENEEDSDTKCLSLDKRVLTEHLEKAERVFSPEVNIKSRLSSPRKTVAEQGSKESIIAISSHSEEEEQQLKGSRPVTRRLEELKSDPDLLKKPARHLSASEMVESLKAAKTEEVFFQKTYSGRRHSISVRSQERSDGNSSQSGRTPRKAATKALEMLVAQSPRKHRVSLSSVQSTEGNMTAPKSSKKAGTQRSSRETGQSKEYTKAKQPIKTQESSCTLTKTPTKKATTKVSTSKRRYSLRVMDKSKALN